MSSNFPVFLKVKYLETIFWLLTISCSCESCFCGHVHCFLSFFLVFLSFFHSFFLSFIHSFIHSCIHSFILSFFLSFILSFFHSFFLSFILSFLHSFFLSLICQFVRLCRVLLKQKNVNLSNFFEPFKVVIDLKRRPKMFQKFPQSYIWAKRLLRYITLG